MNIRRLILSIIILFPSFGSSQILINSSLDLNVGGEIHDVAYDVIQDGYWVVGNFTSIGGYARKNIAFIHADDFSVGTETNLIPVDDVDGVIRAVAIKREWDPGCFCIKNHLYIGGNFTAVDAGAGPVTRTGGAKLMSYLSFGDPASSAGDFLLQSWDPDVDYDLIAYPEAGIYDIEIVNDTVHAVGEFTFVNYSSSGVYRNAHACWDLETSSLHTYPVYSDFGDLRRWHDVELVDNSIYVSGLDGVLPSNTGEIWRLDAAGDVDPTFDVDPTVLMAGFKVEEIDDSLLLIHVNRHGSKIEPHVAEVVRKSDGSEKTDHGFSHVSGEIIGSIGGGQRSMEIYKNYMFSSSSLGSYRLISFEDTEIGPVPGPNWNANASGHPIDVGWEGIMNVKDNLLFTSYKELSTVSGETRNRLSIHCLEPDDPASWTSFDTTVCEGDLVTFTCSLADYAEGYVWEYSGNGADLNDTGADENLYFVKPNPAGNTIPVEFTHLFTEGQLTVRAYTRCNGYVMTSDTLYSNPLTINIHSNPLPNAVAPLDTALTCFVDSILLSGYSDTVGCSYEWLNPGPWGNSIGSDTLATTDGDYIFKVISPLGCPNYDTVQVFLDTIKPDVILPVGPYELTCSDTALSLLGSTSIDDSITFWRNVGSGSTYPNPIIVNNPGNYRYIVQDISNGCEDSLELIVILNQPNPNIKVLGYPPLDPSVPLDTITCYQDTLSLICGSDSLNTVCSWTLADTSFLYGESLDVTTAGNYHILVTDTVSGCTNFTGINISEFTTPPDNILPEGGSINCSVDSIVLDGNSSLIDVDLSWSSASVPDAPDPITAFDPGWYSLTVIRLDNGCTAVDSVFVDESLDIDVTVFSDTLICDGQSATITANYLGDISGITYLWNTGASSSSTSVLGGTDTIVIVEINGDGGCYGSDTASISIPPIPTVSLDEYQPCGDPASGQIVIEVLSGLSPFTYSIDGGTTSQSSPVFDGLTTGSYTITVIDSIGCLHDFASTIDQSSSIPEPSFLVSTYNYVADTVVLVNISSPPPDSIEWIIPIELELLSFGYENAHIILPDSGEYEVGLEAFFGSCSSNITKIISSSLLDTNSATHFNSNGIESIELFPNPTDGVFSVAIDFYKSQRCSMTLTDVSGEVLWSNNYEESSEINENIEFEDAVINGSYILKIISEFDAATVIVVLSR